MLAGASAGIHAALTPVHAAEGPIVAGAFAGSSVALAAAAVLVDRSQRRGALIATALLFAALLGAYAASRIVVVWPLSHAEPVDALGALTKLLEAAGLVVALRLLRSPAGSAWSLPAPQQGASP
jgi:hypothetical protein